MQSTMYDKLLLLPLFQGLCKEDFTSILEKVRLHFQKYTAGSRIVKQGDYCNNIIFILQGEIRAESVDHTYHYTIHETLESPQIIEPYSLFGMYPQYTASYYAHTNVNAITIDKAYILSELNKYEIFQLNYLNMLSNRAQTIYRKLKSPHASDTLDKIVNFMQLRCITPTGEKKLQIRMEDLAEQIDDTRINVSKVLNELKDGGVIRLSRRIIDIPDMETLSNYKENKKTLFMENPFLQPYTTPHGTVPFDKIELVHYEPAIREGISQEDKEINDIISNPEKPTFKNTILALEQSGKLLDQVTTVMFNLMSAETCNELDEIAEKMMPLLSEHSNNISLNEKLFERVKQVYEDRKNLKLTPEELRLLEKTYDGFVRNGANLSEEDKVTFRKISTELSSLTLRFSQNHLKETNSYELLLDSEEQLKGLPESIIEAAAHTAKEKGKNGWIITLQAPSYVPFMKYCENRELRRKLYMAYNTQCIHDNEQNNEDVVKQLVNLRMQLAQLLGFKNYADYALRKRMAENSERVYQLLDQLLEAYTPTAREEVKEIEALAQRTEGKDFQLMPWDFSYYAEKLKNEKFNLDEEALRPYFELSRVKEGVFGLATRLYGISFKENKDIPVYHPDVKAYEVYDKDGSYLAVLYTDFHPRAGKRSGAWMTSYKEQWIEANGTNSRPHVSVTMNFTKPTANKPALLTFSEVNTFLHEFGHALHGIFANTRFKSMSGTNVYWDFVELPSQIMENFTIEKDFLNTFARHYQTNESIPEELLQRIIDASNFNVAYACLRQISFGLLDMAWYTRDKVFDGDVREYEREAWKRTQLLPPVKETCMTVQFGHIMSGGYSAGYYSYKWAEVLDADAFSVFKEKGIFNQDVAQSFRDNILSKGGTEHPMTLYKRFRGQEPTIHALLKRNGIK